MMERDNDDVVTDFDQTNGQAPGLEGDSEGWYENASSDDGAPNVLNVIDEDDDDGDGGDTPLVVPPAKTN